MYYVYILRCVGGSLYTGIAADIEKRLRQHATRGAACAKYTRSHPALALEALWQAEDRHAAARLEYLLKQLRHEKKLALVVQDTTLEALFPGRLAQQSYLRLPCAQYNALFS